MKRTLFVSLVLGLLMAPSVQAAALVKAHDSWLTARPISLEQDQYSFGSFLSAGQSEFFRFHPSSATAIRVVVGVPLGADVRFLPRLVVYQPDQETFGPILPMEQPPQTLAHVYDSHASSLVIDPVTQTSYRVLNSVRLRIPADQNTFLALYNPAGVGGKFRVMFDNPAVSAVSVSTFPTLWWQSQVWSGWSLGSLVVPIAAILLIWLTWKALHRHARYHVQRWKTPPKKLTRQRAHS